MNAFSGYTFICWLARSLLVIIWHERLLQNVGHYAEACLFYA